MRMKRNTWDVETAVMRLRAKVGSGSKFGNEKKRGLLRGRRWRWQGQQTPSQIKPCVEPHPRLQHSIPSNGEEPILLLATYLVFAYTADI